MFEMIISIHAPAKGATLVASSSVAIKFDFNPRTREGCDFIQFLKGSDNTYFNPRTREGCDFLA